ncbi:uncharacterized protein PFL1_06357 [Pseudozyma flocculosa PF-1]|uniref:Large ribosomal subunit protein uL3m n=2 Tax=Pseudozyma flocculosa TaxID=84751 RepID=A0A5C3F9I1_9BASI|nr:uncharacterized protein PFL1_06357 [Pseudozyma flocculosa PF-1]EPQ26149.1 hypothetical protein PFL1_06357 [Pseudozyma flocculosa PF-1]SPO40397.1 related to MRPL9 - mitochondrial ribosomal protein, large subunit [Pseudozyma flocculosa]
MSALRPPVAHRQVLLELVRQRAPSSFHSSAVGGFRPAQSPSHRLGSTVPSSSSVPCLASSSRLLHTSAPRCLAQPAQQASTAKETPASEKATQTVQASAWTPNSQRVGLIAIKQGMTSFFLPNGERIPATVLQVHTNQVSAHIGFDKDPSENPYTAIQVAAVDAKGRNHITRQVLGHLRKAHIKKAKKVIREFPVSRDAIVPLGTKLSAVHFVPGQSIDVRAITRGKGFQGVMKRWDFKGLRASHGVSISHRSHGSTGHSQDPGRVYPGKKMAGRMGGNKHSTIHNLLVLRVDSTNETILVKGNVPGPEGAPVTLVDAQRPAWKAQKIFRRGRLPTGEALTGKEDDSIYLAQGVQKLPFPAGDDKLARTLPPVVEVGLN